ncbi:MAG: NAD(P)-dependent alcohol dehydrogenase [Myxococcaceae bacterium]|nr:NAD(P)-dependent alcohol dehydrogenase [Myxococcaceae bacterium]
MRAFVRDSYGRADVVRLADVPRGLPGEGQVLVRVRATSVNAADKYTLQGRPVIIRFAMGLLRPRTSRLGLDLAGEVVVVGPNVKTLRVGDAVFGTAPDDFGKELDRAYAEYARVPEALLVTKPANVTFEEAAAAPLAGLTALQGLRDDGRVKPGQHVLVNGASGGVGTYAVQIAKALGAEVTAVCSSQNLEQARALGADHVVDYTREDVLAGGPRYDLFFDVSASRPLRACRRVLKPGGQYVAAGAVDRGGLLGPLGSIFGVMFGSIFRNDVRMVTAKSVPEDLVALRALLESGRVRSAIEELYPFERLPDALARFERGHVRGKLVVTV